MTRVVLEILLPFLLPFAAYFGFAFVANRALAKGIRWQDAPWVWLAIIGLSLTVVSFVVMALLGGEDPTKVYVPPRVEGGKIVPGHVE